ncbi:unnamed protein product, partial [Mesorhabditis spiculigera]
MQRFVRFLALFLVLLNGMTAHFVPVTNLPAEQGTLLRKHFLALTDPRLPAAVTEATLQKKEEEFTMDVSSLELSNLYDILGSITGSTKGTPYDLIMPKEDVRELLASLLKRIQQQSKGKLKETTTRFAVARNAEGTQWMAWIRYDFDIVVTPASGTWPLPNHVAKAATVRVGMQYYAYQGFEMLKESHQFLEDQLRLQKIEL